MDVKRDEAFFHEVEEVIEALTPDVISGFAEGEAPPDFPPGDRNLAIMLTALSRLLEMAVEKNRVIHHFCASVGLDLSVEAMTPEERDAVLGRVAQIEKNATKPGEH